LYWVKELIMVMKTDQSIIIQTINLIMKSMKKLNPMGIGPIIGGVILPWLAVSIFLSLRFKGLFIFTENGREVLFYAGLVLLIIGLVMYLLTAVLLLRGLRSKRLMTSGTYFLCCNPLYSSILLFVIPGLSLLMNSWLILTTSLVGYPLFKLFIKSEYMEMEEIFGDEFRKYRTETPEFFPFPFRKWFKSA
jgi:protein-S-isoprenylcysteine O-methyltransferase Ste14